MTGWGAGEIWKFRWSLKLILFGNKVKISLGFGCLFVCCCRCCRFCCAVSFGFHSGLRRGFMSIYWYILDLLTDSSQTYLFIYFVCLAHLPTHSDIYTKAIKNQPHKVWAWKWDEKSVRDDGGVWMKLKNRSEIWWDLMSNLLRVHRLCCGLGGKNVVVNSCRCSDVLMYVLRATTEGAKTELKCRLRWKSCCRSSEWRM